jgi:hypothetical protein
MDKPPKPEGEKMPEIQALTVRAQALSQSVDWWNAAMIWALVFTALAAIAVLVTTRIALKQAKQLAEVQDQIIQAKDIQVLCWWRRLARRRCCRYACWRHSGLQ